MIAILCCNDSIELAFPEGTEQTVIDSEMEAWKDRWMKARPHLKEFPSNRYVHIHQVTLFKAK